jgi:tetratricopeptide (TPR) repeat protein
LEPYNAFALYNRGISNDRRGDYNKAYDDFSAAIGIVPDNADFYHNRAFCLRKLNRFRDAVNDYTLSLNIQPDHFKSLHNRAYCLERLHDLDGAAEDYSRALLLEPRHVASLSARAVVYELLERYDLALADYGSALLCVKDAIRAHASAPGRNSKAGAVAANHISDLRSELHLQVSSARLLSKIGRLDEANAKYTESYALSKNLQNAEKSSSDISGGGGFPAKHQLRSGGNAAAADAGGLDPSLLPSAILCARGINYKSAEQYKRAIEDFSAALSAEQRPQTSSSANAAEAGQDSLLAYPLGTVYNHRGYCFRKLEKYEESIADYTSAIRYSTPQDSVRAYNNRAYCLARIGKFQQAVEDYTAVIGIDPHNSHAFHNRGISLDKLGKYDQAIADFTKVLNIDANMGGSGQESQALSSLDRAELERLKLRHNLSLHTSANSGSIGKGANMATDFAQRAPGPAESSANAASAVKVNASAFLAGLKGHP